MRSVVTMLRNMTFQRAAYGVSMRPEALWPKINYPCLPIGPPLTIIRRRMIDAVDTASIMWIWQETCMPRPIRTSAALVTDHKRCRSLSPCAWIQRVLSYERQEAELVVASPASVGGVHNASEDTRNINPCRALVHAPATLIGTLPR